MIIITITITIMIMMTITITFKHDQGATTLSSRGIVAGTKIVTSFMEISLSRFVS